MFKFYPDSSFLQEGRSACREFQAAAHQGRANRSTTRDPAPFIDLPMGADSHWLGGRMYAGCGKTRLTLRQTVCKIAWAKPYRPCQQGRRASTSRHPGGNDVGGRRAAVGNALE